MLVGWRPTTAGTVAAPRRRRTTGCVFRCKFDRLVMDLAEQTHADEWAVGDDIAAKLDLFTEVGAEMKAAARAGIRRVLRDRKSVV